MQPWIACSSLRIDVAGIPAIDGLSLRSETASAVSSQVGAAASDRGDGDTSRPGNAEVRPPQSAGWVLVLGAARALFEAAAGLRAIERGELTIGGLGVMTAIRAGAATGAPCDPRLPGEWTVRNYVTWSARLAGLADADARASAEDAMERLQLQSVAAAPLRRVSAIGRRGVVLAAALATGARTLLVEDPFVGLAPPMARSFARATVHALAERRVVFFGASLALDSPVGLAADEAIAIAGSRVLAQGAPGEVAASEGTFGLVVAGNAASFVQALRAAGAEVDSPDGSAPARLTVRWGVRRTTDMLRMAIASGAVVLELRPLGSAFA